MERPHVEIQPKSREITAEIAYLDHMRRLKQFPKAFENLSEMAIQLYEGEAELFKAQGTHPEIIDEYERYDAEEPEVIASCIALADELLKLKEPGSRLTFVDMIVEGGAKNILAKLKDTKAGQVLAADDEQLAIPSNGEYYPILDMRKENAKLRGVGLRVWGWDEQKFVYTNKDDEPFNGDEHVLMYPSDEKSFTRKLELTFSYKAGEENSFSESVSLYMNSRGYATIGSQIWASAYAETGYEGHGGKTLHDVSDEDIAAFGDLVAEIVGDTPESVGMRIDRQLQERIEAAVTPAAQKAIQDLIETTWTAQANYYLSLKLKGADKPLGEQLADEKTVDAAIEGIERLIKKWQERRGI